MIGNAKVVDADHYASNGVIHVINSVILSSPNVPGIPVVSQPTVVVLQERIR